MPVLKLTKRAIDELTPKDRPFVAYDAELKGFGIRVLPSGAKSWILEYRPGSGGRGVAKKRLTLGSAKVLTPDQARRAAREHLANVRLGADPGARRKAEREGITVAELARVFMTEHVEAKRKPATVALYRHIVDSEIIPALGSRKAEQLTPGEVAKLHSRLGDRPYMANRMLAVVSSMFSWGGGRGLIPKGINPTADVENFAETARERFLTADELQRLGEAIREAETDGIPWEPNPDKKVKHAPKPENRRAKIGSDTAAAIRLLLFTGARLREILHLRWSEVDLDRGLLFLGDSKTGKKTIVLNSAAVAVLSDLPRLGPYVFPGEPRRRKDGKAAEPQPRADLKRPWALVSKRAGLEGVRLHDLRHTHASIGAGAGLGLPIIGKLLGHTQAATTARYAHLDADPLRRASEAIGSAIAGAMGERRKRRS